LAAEAVEVEVDLAEVDFADVDFAVDAFEVDELAVELFELCCVALCCARADCVMAGTAVKQQINPPRSKPLTIPLLNIDPPPSKRSASLRRGGPSAYCTQEQYPQFSHPVRPAGSATAAERSRSSRHKALLGAKNSRPKLRYSEHKIDGMAGSFEEAEKQPIALWSGSEVILAPMRGALELEHFPHPGLLLSRWFGALSGRGSSTANSIAP
jgi:hypothetical protein